MSEKVIDFLARKKAKEEGPKVNTNNVSRRDFPDKTPEKNIESILSSVSGKVDEETPQKTIESVLSTISSKLEGKQKDFLTLFADMLQIEKLVSSPTTDATEEIHVKDYTKEQCIERLLESNYLDWNKKASFYKAIVRKLRTLNYFEKE